MNEFVPGHIDPTGSHTLQVIAKADRFNKWIYDSIHPFLKGEILEIGSGIGNISACVVADGKSITLSDINTEYQQYLHERFSRNTNVRDVLSIDLQQPQFAATYSSLKEKFDTIFLLNVIEHLQDDKAAIENCNFMLRPGGHLIVLAPAMQTLYNRFDKELGHYRRYTKAGLSSLFHSNSFTCLQKRYFNFAGIAGWLWFGKVLNRKMIGSGEMNAYETFVPLFKLVDKLVFQSIGLTVIVTARKK